MTFPPLRRERELVSDTLRALLFGLLFGFVIGATLVAAVAL